MAMIGEAPSMDMFAGTENPNIRIHYHRSTSNTSFIEMSNYLKTQGIRNYRFMLTLLDPDLAYIDPHDPNLPTVYQLKVLHEVTYNFWYFLREVVRIPVAGPPSPFLLNRGNMAFLYLATMNINTILLMPRQVGKTIAAAVFYVWIYNFKTQNSQISLLNKELRDSKDNLARIRSIRDLLPSYLRMDAVFSLINGRKTKVSSTVIFMEHAVNHNKFRTYSKAKNEMSAANLLRGQTFQHLWVDEFAFVPWMDVIYSNMIPAMTTAISIAKRNLATYGILYTTTPGFLTTNEGRYAYECINNATKFNEHWYDLAYKQILDIISSNKLSTFVHIQFNYRELGYSEEWFKNRCQEQNWKWPVIRREYLLEWSDESENNPFTKEELDGIKKFCKDPIKTILILNKYELKLYEPIPLNSAYIPLYPPIIGVDPSGGVSRDSSCITIIDSRTTRVFAELGCNTISIIDMARAIQEIVTKLMPNAVINVERNGGFGQSIIAKLKEGPCKRNLYYEIKDRVLEETTDGTRIIRTKRKKKIYGLDNSGKTRELLVELLKERVTHHKDKFISPTIYKELRGLETKRNGRVEHSDLTHDDQIFSYLMAMYVWYEGKNLRDLFGIDKVAIKTEENIDDIVDIGIDEEYGSIMQEIAYINRDDQDKLEKELASMNAAKGIMLGDFMEKQRKQEQEQLKMMLNNPIVREAYARSQGIDPNAIAIGDSDSLGNMTKLPNSIFTDFTKDYSESDIYNDLDDIKDLERKENNQRIDDELH